MKKLMISAAALAIAASGAATGALADTSGKRIALSNNYAGNSWRQAMLQSWNDVGAGAVSGGIVAAADAFTTSENQATEQAAQIQNMILQGYDAIVLNAASPTALNGAVKEACDAGVIRQAQWCHQSTGSIQRPRLLAGRDARSLPYWWLGFDRSSRHITAPGEDVTVLRDKAIAITPLRHREALPDGTGIFDLAAVAAH